MNKRLQVNLEYIDVTLKNMNTNSKEITDHLVNVTDNNSYDDNYEELAYIESRIDKLLEDVNNLKNTITRAYDNLD